jgi:hypothetical protein
MGFVRCMMYGCAKRIPLDVQYDIYEKDIQPSRAKNLKTAAGQRLGEIKAETDKLLFKIWAREKDLTKKTL